jgi:hypothetical protein
VSILDQIDLIACSLPHIDVPVIITTENSLKEISRIPSFSGAGRHHHCLIKNTVFYVFDESLLSALQKFEFKIKPIIELHPSQMLQTE